MPLSATDPFQPRHIGPGPDERQQMLDTIGVASLDELITQTVPDTIRLNGKLNLPEPESESEYLARLRNIAGKNKRFKSYIGMGYYDCLTPSVILRNVIENPGWYTPYTPYQAEIAQGRLEALLNFQTMVTDLTGMDVANASLLDEATAAAEAMMMLYRLQSRGPRKGAHTFFVDETCYPQTIDVLRSHAAPVGIRLAIGCAAAANLSDDLFGALIQYPNGHGGIDDPAEFIAAAHSAGLLVAVASDLLALTLLTPPGALGADVVLGNSQRFGVPMGFGGPHAAFFATRERFMRETPGRIIGVSIDAHGHPAYRMSLQTREQHIRREKAKSNICTAQALLAAVAGMYAVYHGPQGLLAIARRVHTCAGAVANAAARLGYQNENEHYFDTLKLRSDGADSDRVRARAVEAGMNFRYYEDGAIGISVDETTTRRDVDDIITVLAEAVGRRAPNVQVSTDADVGLPPGRIRSGPVLTHPIFNAYHSETKMMRYLKHLERKDIGLDTSMIPLGSCTMKLNAASEMIPVTWPEFCGLHPFAPTDQTQGYQQVFEELCAALCAITGFAAVSLQPNSGAQGEYTGLMVIRAYHLDRGDNARDVVLIPSSAHGTNPASAVMAGMNVVVVECDERGNIDVADLRAKTIEHGERLAALMVTYPSTHGVFEESIQEICALVHEQGGQVYMDGANLNAQVGLTSPAVVGADVCHINLHKTFAIPHGGGGPGMGPIAVAEHLTPYLPGHPVVKTGGSKAISAVSAAPWGSAAIVLISHAYICMLGGEGCTAASQHSILNANYIKARLQDHYDVLYTGPHGRVAHEMIFDLRPCKQASGADETDVAKRLMDYGFHAPTVSWPVPGTMMIEPTECEDKAELDRFCDALIAIRGEFQALIDGTADAANNVLKNAPHTAAAATSDSWPHPYTREQAVYPLPYLRERKFWPSVGRIDNTHGDRHLVCTCPAVASYADASDS